MDNKLERVSEIIDKEEIQSWKNGEIITISAGTGVGKSYFIKNTLFDYVKERGEKILFLIHRKNALNQFKIELENDGKLDVIDVKTYQHIKEKYKKNEEFNFSPYSYIVSDEFHYFMKDAEFDKFIDIALTAILEQKHCIRIFMSATGNDMETYFENIIKIETKKYNIENDNTFIRHLLFYSKQESLEAILNKHIQENKKAIIFTTAKKAYELYEKYIECSIFNCSESNDYYKFVDKEKINGILINEMFEELFLFTTTTMDTGVNIIDPLLHTVICELYNFDDIRQSIGRKRLIDSNDYIDLYVRERTNYEIEKSMNSLSNALNKAEVLKRFNEEEFLKRYPRDVETSGIYYMEFEDGYVRLKLNNLVLGSTYLRHKEYKIILENGYKNCIADWLDVTAKINLTVFAHFN